MYQAHWGLNATPFAVEQAARSYFPSETAREGLARVSFALENAYRVVLVSGGAGVGKTTFLRQVVHRYDAPTRQFATLSLLGLEDDEFLTEIALQLGEASAIRRPIVWSWRRIQDRLRLNTQQHLHTVLLLDDAADAEHSVLNAILRLTQVAANYDCWLTILLTTEQDRVALLGSRLLDLIQLRIDLDAWCLEDTTRFICEAVAAAGGETQPFDRASLAAIHQLACGNPRRVRQLAELTLIAGAGVQLSQIDTGFVEAVHGELLSVNS
jgi:type II secretory pathway predicted ATPase ExeA